MINPRIEHSKCQVGKPTDVGLMFEITAPVAPVTEATTRKAKALIFVIDRSGSMSGGRLEMVKTTILDTLPRLNPEDYISVVSFDDEAFVNVGLVKIGEADRKKIATVISAIECGGSTNLEAGYRLGLNEASKAQGVDSNIILLSDGQANRGMQDPEGLANLATAATEYMVTTSTIGIGQGYDENILAALADGGNGNHIAGLSHGEALDGLQSEIDGLLQKTMLDVKFEIVLGPDFTGPKSNIIAGRRMKKWIRLGSTVNTLLGDISSGEERNVLFDLTLDAHPMATAGVKQGVKVSWSYVDVNSGQTVTGEHTFEIDLVDSVDWVEPDRDADITAELKIVRSQKLFDQVMQLYRQGRESEADALLEAAGKDMDDFMQSANLSKRQYERMFNQSTSIKDISLMADLNMKSKWLSQERNRTARDRKWKPGNN